MTTNAPASSEEWLQEIARAYLDAKEAQPFGEAVGEPVAECDLFHLAPHVFIKFRGLQLSKRRRAEIVELVLASYVVTMDEGAGREHLRDSPILSFAFCFLAAHFVVDILDEEAVQVLMEVCVERRSDLERLIGAGP